jgi:hypothetical protein
LGFSHKKRISSAVQKRQQAPTANNKNSSNY